MKSLSLSQPHAIIMVGLPGSGKSFFASKFASTFGAPYVSHDRIKSIANIDHTAVERIANQQLGELIKTKHSLVIEGASDTRASRTELVKSLSKQGYQSLFVWVQTDSETAKTRSLKANQRSIEEYDLRTKRFSAPHATENSIVISGKHTYATQAKVVLKRLSAPRAEISTHSTPPVRSFIDIRQSK